MGQKIRGLFVLPIILGTFSERMLLDLQGMNEKC